MSQSELEYFIGAVIVAVGSSGGIAFALIREAIRKSRLKRAKKQELLNNLNESMRLSYQQFLNETQK
jgi:uncharacterized membrane protein YdjX (TVP38/TMEM64 family)